MQKSFEEIKGDLRLTRRQRDIRRYRIVVRPLKAGFDKILGFEVAAGYAIKYEPLHANVTQGNAPTSWRTANGVFVTFVATSAETMKYGVVPFGRDGW
ncbi:MAG: hypothetical protein HY248_03420 [Fimbriimonas ginsengisoli]|nr:hypothetical protein [Fimbriimonas ginsengisoli]